MAAEIKPVEQKNGISNNWKSAFRRIELLSRIEGLPFQYNHALLFGEECQAVVAACNNKLVKIWIKNNRNKYICSTEHFVPAAAMCLCLDTDINKIYVGLQNGTIVEFLMSDDFKHLHHARDVLAHTDKVNCLHLSHECHWLLSGSKDKHLHWYDTTTGKKVDKFPIDSWVTCLQFDAPSHCAFVGDIAGQITVLKLNKNTPTILLTILSGHSASIRSLAWDGDRNTLYSGGGDNLVVVWDIGGKKGVTYELNCHQDKVECLEYMVGKEQLLSSGNDGLLVAWNMQTQRKQTETWSEADKCEVCEDPFFWNISMMWHNRALGGRQHHCRKCGKAVCSQCSSGTSVLPQYGYELPVRLCSPCLNSLTPQDLVPLAMTYQCKHKVMKMHLNVQHKRLLTVGKDNTIKIWDLIENKNDKY